MTLLELFLVTALCLFFSCFSTPVLSAIFTFVIYVVGTMASDLRAFGQLSQNQWMQQLSTLLYYLIPNFSDFAVAGAVSHGQPVALRLILLNTLYTLLYGGLLLAASAWIFSRRDLK